MDNKVIKVKEDIYWIGILDEKLRTFDIIMETKYGTTYNSYFINADKTAVRVHASNAGCAAPHKAIKNCIALFGIFLDKHFNQF